MKKCIVNEVDLEEQTQNYCDNINENFTDQSENNIIHLNNNNLGLHSETHNIGKSSKNVNKIKKYVSCH